MVCCAHHSFSKYEFGKEKCDFGACGVESYDAGFDASDPAAQVHMIEVTRVLRVLLLAYCPRC